MVNTEIRLIIFFAAKNGEALCSQQKQDLELTVPQIIPGCLKIESSNRNPSKTTALEILECPPEEVVFELGL